MPRVPAAHLVLSLGKPLLDRPPHSGDPNQFLHCCVGRAVGAKGGTVGRVVWRTAHQEPASHPGGARLGECDDGPVVDAWTLAPLPGRPTNPRIASQTFDHRLCPLALPIVFNHLARQDPNDIGLSLLLEPLTKVVGTTVEAVGDHLAGGHLGGERPREHLFR
jgi:hypothetical protein